MKVKTHYVIALEAYKLIKPYLPVTLNERALKMGACMPDIAPHRRFKAHNIKIAAKEWKAFVSLVDRKPTTPFWISYAAGIMSHYISDTFCYAHNFKNLSLREHRSYEVYMNKQAKEFTHLIKPQDIFKRWNTLKQEGVEAYIEVENSCYKKEAAKCKTRDEHVALDLYESIVHTGVWMLEAASILYPAFCPSVLI